MALPILAALLPVVSGILDKIIPDKGARDKARAELVLLEVTGDLKIDLENLAINIEEAKHKSLWVSGWRPYIGWACGTAFVYHTLILPILTLILIISGVDVAILPEFDMSLLMTVLGGLLGLGSLRTYEKLKGVARK